MYRATPALRACLVCGVEIYLASINSLFVLDMPAEGSFVHFVSTANLSFYTEYRFYSYLDNIRPR